MLVSVTCEDNPVCESLWNTVPIYDRRQAHYWQSFNDDSILRDLLTRSTNNLVVTVGDRLVEGWTFDQEAHLSFTRNTWVIILTSDSAVEAVANFSSWSGLDSKVQLNSQVYFLVTGESSAASLIEVYRIAPER